MTKKKKKTAEKEDEGSPAAEAERLKYLPIFFKFPSFLIQNKNSCFLHESFKNIVQFENLIMDITIFEII